MVETCDTIKLCVKLGYKPNEMLSLLQRGEDISEIKRYDV